MLLFPPIVPNPDCSAFSSECVYCGSTHEGPCMKYVNTYKSICIQLTVYVCHQYYYTDVLTLWHLMGNVLISVRMDFTLMYFPIALCLLECVKVSSVHHSISLHLYSLCFMTVCRWKHLRKFFNPPSVGHNCNCSDGWPCDPYRISGSVGFLFHMV